MMNYNDTLAPIPLAANMAAAATPAPIRGVTLAETAQTDQQTGQTVVTDTLTFGTPGTVDTAYGLILGYGILLLFLWAISKTRIGYAAIYYGLCLLILLLVATQARFISGALANVAPAAATPGAGSGAWANDPRRARVGHGLPYR